MKMTGARHVRGILVALIAAAMFASFSACNRTCPVCQGAGKIARVEPCSVCAGTGSVRSKCPINHEAGRTFISQSCRFCGGTGVLKCKYCLTFTFVEPATCGCPSGSAVKGTACCVKGRLQAGNFTSDQAFGAAHPNRMCPRCFGTGSVVCSACNGSGKTLIETTCKLCMGSGWILKSCAVCGGTGEIKRVDACTACKGTGYKPRLF